MGFTANDRSREGATRLRPLFRLAAVNGLEAAVKEQLRRGADVNATDQRGCSPLMLASAAGHLETCRVLLEAGADLQLLDVDGNDALTMAVTHGRDEVAALLRRFLIPLTPRAILDTPEHQPEQNQSTDGCELEVWEVYEEPTLPARSGEGVLADALTLQRHLSEHTPIDHYDNWLDVDIDLPAVRARSYRGGLDDEVREIARGIICCGLRDGRIPAWRLAALSVGGEDRDDDLRVSLYVTLGDLGVVIDDSSSDDRDFDASVTIEAGDELLVDEALDFMSAMWSRECDPLYLYRKEIGSTNLLTREGEVETARRIERGKLSVIKSISRTPLIAKNVIELGDRLHTGDRTIRELVIFDDEEITEERIQERSRQVQKQIDAVRLARGRSERLEEELRVTPKGATSKDKRKYRRARWAAMRARVELSRYIRKIEFTEPVKRRLIDVMKDAVDSVQRVQREIEGYNRLLNPKNKKQRLKEEARKNALRQTKDLRRNLKTRTIREGADFGISAR
jgi:hypothetical protein